MESARPLQPLLGAVAAVGNANWLPRGFRDAEFLKLKAGRSHNPSAIYAAAAATGAAPAAPVTDADARPTLVLRPLPRPRTLTLPRLTRDLAYARSHRACH